MTDGPDYMRDRVQELIELRGRTAASFAQEGYGDLIDSVRGRLMGFLEGPLMAPYPNLMGMTYRLEDLVMQLRVLCGREGAGTYPTVSEGQIEETVMDLMAWSTLVYGEMLRRRHVDRADIVVPLMQDKAELLKDLGIARDSANRNNAAMLIFVEKMKTLAAEYEKDTGKKWSWGPEGRQAMEIIGDTPLEKRGPQVEEMPLRTGSPKVDDIIELCPGFSLKRSALVEMAKDIHIIINTDGQKGFVLDIPPGAGGGRRLPPRVFVPESLYKKEKLA
jgi:hypothetical protein